MSDKPIKYSLIATLAISLALANVLAAKLAWIQLPVTGHVAVPAGFVGIAVAFLCTDLLSELYGRSTARWAVNGSLIALVIGVGLIYTALWMPAAPFYDGSAAYQATLGTSALVVVASILTMLVSQNLDVSAFHWIKARAPSKAARNVGSTAISQFVDTALFITLAFAVLPALTGGSAQPFGAVWALIVGQYLVKLVLVAADTPFFYALSWAGERLNATPT